MSATITNEYLRKELDNFEKTDDLGNLFGELKYSTLIAPVNDEKTACAMISMADKVFIPLFTDIHEYQKVNFDDEFHPEAFDFNFYLELLGNGLYGFIVNVDAERFPITGEFLDFMDTDYKFDLEYHPFTAKEIKSIYDSINNAELNDFLEDPENHWDTESLMELLLKSDILAVVASKENLDDYEEKGVIPSKGELLYCRNGEKFAVIFSSPDKIKPPHNNINFYSQIVNLPLFIDYVLKSDLAGIKLNEEIVIPRDFLLDFMNGFRCPCIDKYDDYIFKI